VNERKQKTGLVTVIRIRWPAEMAGGCWHQSNKGLEKPIGIGEHTIDR
jgi:hypothetical protein